MIGILGHREKPTSFKDDVLLVTYTVMLGSSWNADIPPVPDLVVHRKDDVLLVTDIVALEYTIYIYLYLMPFVCFVFVYMYILFVFIYEIDKTYVLK